jgi:outer membrane protein OmpA-like peptidoglycan-associated protein
VKLNFASKYNLFHASLIAWALSAGQYGHAQSASEAFAYERFSIQLTADSEKNFALLIQKFKDAPECLMISGWSDTDGSNRSLERLGYLRMARIHAALIEAGVKPSRIQKQSKGKTTQIGEAPASKERRIVSISRKACPIEYGKGAESTVARSAERPDPEGTLSLNYAMDSDIPTPTHIDTLKGLLAKLKHADQAEIEILGSTDATGAAGYNELLAASRAFKLAEVIWAFEIPTLTTKVINDRSMVKAKDQAPQPQQRKVTLRWNAELPPVEEKEKFVALDSLLSEIDEDDEPAPKKERKKRKKRKAREKPEKEITQKTAEIKAALSNITSQWFVGAGYAMATAPSSLNSWLGNGTGYEGFAGMKWTFAKAHVLSLLVDVQRLSFNSTSEDTSGNLISSAAFIGGRYGFVLGFITPFVEALAGMSQWQATATDTLSGEERILAGQDPSSGYGAGLEFKLASNFKLSMAGRYQSIFGEFRESFPAGIVSLHWESTP